MKKRRYIKQKIIQLFDRAEIMKKILKWFGVAAVYIGVALVVILIMQYFYLSSDFFRSLFEGGTLQAAPAAEGASGTAPGTGSNLTETTAKLSFYILIFVMLLQLFAFITALWVFLNLAKSREPCEIRMKKMENADLFLDLPLYFGLFGTVSSFIVMSFNPQISRLIAYSSTLVGIIFSVVLRVTLQYPIKQKLLGERIKSDNFKLGDREL